MINSRILLSFLTLLLVFCGFAANAEAQQTQNQTPAQNTEIMGENDRLPFMQTDQTAENSEPTSGSLLFKTFGAMFLIVGLLFFGAWGAKKYGLFGAKAIIVEDAPDLRVMSSVSIANGQTISAVRFGERVLLVGSTAQSFTLLAEDFGDEEAVLDSTPKSVSDLLAEENSSFGKELETAQNRMTVWKEKGGKI